MADSMLVRIKPFNPKKGHIRRTHIEQKYGMKFKVEGGWYEVPSAVARELRKTLQNPDDPESPEVFDVMTKAQAQEVRQYEELKVERLRATPDAPTKLRIRRPVGQRSPDDQAEDELTELSEEVRVPPARAPQAETRAGRAVRAGLGQRESRYEESGLDADDDGGDLDFGGPPYGAPAEEADDSGEGDDRYDPDLSDVVAASEPPSAKFKPEPKPARRGRGRPAKSPRPA